MKYAVRFKVSMSIFPENKNLKFSGLQMSAFFECCIINYSTLCVKTIRSNCLRHLVPLKPLKFIYDTETTTMMLFQPFYESIISCLSIIPKPEEPGPIILPQDKALSLNGMN